MKRRLQFAIKVKTICGVIHMCFGALYWLFKYALKIGTEIFNKNIFHIICYVAYSQSNALYNRRSDVSCAQKLILFVAACFDDE